MEFKSLPELIRYVESAFAVQFYSGSGTLRKGVLKIIAAVVGGALYMFSLLAKNIWKNRFVSTCDVIALDGFGTEYGIPHKAPSYARGFVQVDFSGSASSITIPANTFFVDSISKKEYQTVVSQVVNSSNQSIQVIAVEAGAASNASIGSVFQFRDSTPIGLKDDITVVADYSGYGIDYGYSVDVEFGGDVQKWGETAEEYRSRLLNRIQNPPQGGSENDYRMMAERFNFVSKAYVVANAPNLNTVSVCLANYNIDGIAVGSDYCNEVYNYINKSSSRNICADVRVFSVTPITFTLKASVSPFNQKVKDSVDLAIKNFLKEIKPGKTANIDSIESNVTANSLATSFKVLSLSKSGTEVARFDLAFDAGTSLAEVAIAEATYINGGS